MLWTSAFVKSIQKDHPLLNTISKYKEDLGIKTIFFGELADLIEDRIDVVISVKMDGLFVGIEYKDGEVKAITTHGTVFSDLPALRELADMLKGKGISYLFGFGEMYGMSQDGRPLSLLESSKFLKSPDVEEEQRIHFILFDIYKLNDEEVEYKPYAARVVTIMEVLEGGDKFKSAIFEAGGLEEAQALWDGVLQKDKYGYEGLVLTIGEQKYKIKPLLSLDLVIVAVSKSDVDPDGVAALLTSFMDEAGRFRFDGRVSSGLSKGEREEWLEWARRNMISEDEQYIYVDPYKEPRVVEVIADEVSFKESPAYAFEDDQYVFIEEKLVGSLRMPRFNKIRDDKDVIPSDLRLTQMPGFPEAEASAEDATKKDKKTQKKTEETKKTEKTKKKSPDGFKRLGPGEPGSEYIGAKVRLINKPDYVGTIIKIAPSDRGGTPYDYDLVVQWEKTLMGRDKTEVHPSEIEIIEERQSDYSIADFAVDRLKPQQERHYATDRHAYAPKHPDTVMVESNAFYKDGLTEADVYSYYDTPIVKGEILRWFSDFGHDAIVMVKTDKNGLVVRRHQGNEVNIKIDAGSYEKLNNGRNIEFHFSLGRTTPFIFADLDPKEGFPFDDVKRIAVELAGRMDDTLDDVCYTSIHFSGGDGFHVYGWLKEEIDVDMARDIMKDLMLEYIDESGDKRLTTEVTKEKGTMRLDTTTMHEKGGLRVPYSLSSDTGLVCLFIDKSAMDAFTKDMATIHNVLNIPADGRQAMITQKNKIDISGMRWVRNPEALFRYAILEEYVQKRDFAKTSEPKGSNGVKLDRPMFVVQKHNADRAGLHFDFRISESGILKSWAVPKFNELIGGLQARVLALSTEDHPTSYLNFAGVIPRGQYGAGTIDIFDSGPYEVVSKDDKSYKINLAGKKVKGYFNLVHLKEKQWLLSRTTK